jgi:hypothetical protein
LGHQNLETTLEYLQIAQLESQQKFTPLTLFACSPVADVLRKLGNRNYRIKHLAITHLISYKTMQNGRIGHIDACDECGNLTISYNLVAIGIALNVRGINEKIDSGSND